MRESVIRQAKIVLSAAQDGDRSYCSKRQLECRSRLQELQDEKQQLYESLVLGDIRSEEYKERKTALDADLARQRDVYEVICNQEEKIAPSAASIKAAREALESGELEQELVDLLIDKVLVYPDNRIEIQWRVSSFGNYISSGAGDCSN